MKPRPQKLPPALSACGPTPGLLTRVVAIIEGARVRVVRSVHGEIVLSNWHIGREIVEEVQRGADRATYGEAVLQSLSADLTTRYGRGYGIRNLRYFREFYLAFSDRIPEIRQSNIAESPASPTAAIQQSGIAESNAPAATTLLPRTFSPDLSWGHYRVLSSVDRPMARSFYEIEAINVGWSVEELQRQIHTSLFDRLRKSRNKAGAQQLAAEGLVLQRPVDTLREPYVLDFLALPEDQRLHETELESAIVGKLQEFLLELGKGFAFLARQKRLQYDGQNLYVDLVFYNCILKCYLLIDLKIGTLTHKDVGQMDSYVRLFDHQYTNEGDNPTIGLILCTEKNEAVARYSVLHESQQIFAARYLAYLPTIEELERELQRERLLIESRQTVSER